LILLLLKKSLMKTIESRNHHKSNEQVTNQAETSLRIKAEHQINSKVPTLQLRDFVSGTAQIAA
jgi:hypothetical protein